MDFISLFSGIGGFDLGFERAGMTCVAQVENNAPAASVLARHFPNVERFGDVRHVGRNNLPAADLICGGFPCQDLSVAGNRAGLAGNRSGLWFEFLRVLTELTPQFCVIENVPGLLSSSGGRDFAILLHGLVECGYGVAWRVLDAQYFGVAQHRRRVFIVGSLGDGRAAEILFERTSGAGDIEPGGAAGQRLAADAEESAQGGVFGNTGRGYWQEGAQTLAARDYKDVKNVVAGTLGAAHARNRGLGNENEASFLVAESIDARNSRGNGDISGTLQSKTNGGYSLNYQNPIAFSWAASQSANISAGRLSPTIKTQHNGSPAVQSVYEGVRRLTPTECERLQGFPDGWTAGQSDSARYRQLGNAVAVPVIEWIGRRLIAAHE